MGSSAVEEVVVIAGERDLALWLDNTEAAHEATIPIILKAARKD